MLCIVNRFAWSTNADALLCTFAIIEVGIPYGCSLGRFCTFVFRSSSLGLTNAELGTLAVKGTPAVNGGTKVLIYGRVIGEDFETVEGVVTPVSIETGIAMVSPTAVDKFKSLKGVVTCKDCAYEDDCEEDERA